MAANGFVPIFDNIMRQNLLNYPQFSFYFSSYPLQQSAIMFGEADPKYFIEPIFYFPVTNKYYWQIEMKDISINGVRQNFCPLENCRLAIDTGTSLITGPSPDVAVLQRSIKMKEDCENYGNLPTIVIHLGDYDFPLYPADYILKSRNGQVYSMEHF
jgi:cathepsin D